jgi:hypothetical protein
MGTVRINQLPDGSGDLTSDDLLIFMDNPSGNSVTKKISFDNFKLTSTQLPDVIEARLSLLNDTDIALSQIVLNSGEIAIPLDKNYLRVGDGISTGGKIIADGTSYIEKNPNVISYTFADGFKTFSTQTLTVVPSQTRHIIRIEGSGVNTKTFDYPGLWTNDISWVNIPSGATSVTFNHVGLNGIATGTFSSSTCSGIYFPNLKILNGSIVSAGGAASGFPLNIISMPEVRAIFGNVVPNVINFNNFYAPNLEHWENGNLTFATTVQSNMSNIDLPNLESLSALTPSNMAILTQINFPKLKYITTTFGGTYANLPALSGIFLPSIEYIGCPITISSGVSSSTLVNFNLGSGLKLVNGDVNINNHRLNSSSVENTLIRLANLNGTSGTFLYPSGRTVSLQGGTSAGLSTLSPLGSGARSTLISRGVTVNLNP